MAEGPESLGGSGGMLLRKMFENDVAGEAIWCVLGPTQREKIYFIFAQFLCKFGTTKVTHQWIMQKKVNAQTGRIDGLHNEQ